MKDKILKPIKKLPKTISYSLIALAIWEIWLIWHRTHWINILLLISGATVGYLIMEINWVFPKKQVRNLLPIILLPISLFVITSTAGILGKAIIVFLNLRLILDKTTSETNNNNQ